MTTWWLAFSVLFCLTAAGVLLPILVWPPVRGHSRAVRAGAVLQDKLAQVARDREAGLIGAEEARGAEAEIARALIATAKEAEAERSAATPASGGRAGIALVACIALFGAIALYQINGSFSLPDQPIAQRDGADSGMADLASEHDGNAMGDAIASLRTRLEQEPSNTDAWHLLARSYSAVGAHADSAAAYARLIELMPGVLEYRGDHAEALIRADGGFVGPVAVRSLEEVLAQEPEDPRARYYLALRDAQNGEPLKAAQGWIRILRNAPPEAPYRPAIRSILNTVIEDAGLDREALAIPPEPVAEPATAALQGPSAEDVAAAAAMPEAEQLEMIRGMVARLESRLAEEPGDVDGWIRLARSRMVLGEPEAGISALERALAENPGDSSLLAALAELREAVAR